MFRTCKKACPCFTQPVKMSAGYMFPLGDSPKPIYPRVFTCASNVMWVALVFQYRWKVPFTSSCACCGKTSLGVGTFLVPVEWDDKQLIVPVAKRHTARRHLSRHCLNCLLVIFRLLIYVQIHGCLECDKQQSSFCMVEIKC